MTECHIYFFKDDDFFYHKQLYRTFTPGLLKLCQPDIKYFVSRYPIDRFLSETESKNMFESIVRSACTMAKKFECEAFIIG